MKSGFTNDKYPNLHIRFVGNGVELVVSLNIERSMIPFLNQQCVHKSEQLFTYVLKTILTEITECSVEGGYRWLLCQAMIDCRVAKQKAMAWEIKNLEYEKTNVQLDLFGMC